MLFLAIVSLLALGHAVAGALFWTLLQVPESNALMLALSALLVLLMASVAGYVEVLALLSWTPNAAWRTTARRAGRAIPASLCALALFAAIFWATAVAGTWHIAVRGELDAWMMAHLGLVTTWYLHSAVDWLLWFVRYGLGLSLALSLLASQATSGLAALARLQWLRAGAGIRRLLVVGGSMFVFVWLPWQAIYWRPSALPPTWLEPVFIAAKLVIAYLLANIGWALALRTVALPTPAPVVQSPQSTVDG